MNYNKLVTFLITLIIFLPGCALNSDRKDADRNDYFFNPDTGMVSCEATLKFGEVRVETTQLTITYINKFSNGTVYSICIDAKGYAPVERENIGYFYVQRDKIYVIEKSLYTDSLDESEIVIIGTVVCQEEEKKDALPEDEEGWHEYIFVNADTIEYHAYNNQVATGYYETFVWKKGVGLVQYRSGFGAGRDAIEFVTSGDTGTV